MDMLLVISKIRLITFTVTTVEFLKKVDIPDLAYRSDHHSTSSDFPTLECVPVIDFDYK